MLALHDLEQALHKLKAIIAETCREYSLPEGKMETLFPYLSIKEKNELMACQRYAISCEKIIKNKLKNIKSQVEVQMALPEILHKTRMQHMQENGVQTNIYNQKY